MTLTARNRNGARIRVARRWIARGERSARLGRLAELVVDEGLVGFGDGGVVVGMGSLCHCSSQERSSRTPGSQHDGVSDAGCAGGRRVASAEDVRDAAGRTLMIECSSRGVRVSSRGPDGIAATEDDLAFRAAAGERERSMTEAARRLLEQAVSLPAAERRLRPPGRLTGRRDSGRHYPWRERAKGR